MNTPESSPTKFYKLIKEILNTLRMEKAEFQRLTGINPVNITWWEQHPETLPQMKTIKRIEQGLGIVFEFDEEGRPTAWLRSESSPSADDVPMVGVHSKEKVLASSVPTTKTAATRSAGLVVPATPTELYDQSELYGDKKEWSELSAKERTFYENLYQVFLLEVDEANNAYERTIEQAVLARAHTIEDSKQKVRRAMLNFSIGNFEFSSNLPL